jgi:hypothetical protein
LVPSKFKIFKEFIMDLNLRLIIMSLAFRFLMVIIMPIQVISHFMRIWLTEFILNQFYFYQLDFTTYRWFILIFFMYFMNYFKLEGSHNLFIRQVMLVSIIDILCCYFIDLIIKWVNKYLPLIKSIKSHYYFVL